MKEVNSTAIFGDCMEFMSVQADNAFDLAIVDPEFGIDIGNSNRLVLDKGLPGKSWDAKPISPAYFTELFRVSRNQIIWGGNYYPLPACKHCIIWDKKQPEALSFGMFDYAWTSFSKANKAFRLSAMDEAKCRIHPTQKPVKLYQWLLQNYADPGHRILDTHLGSGSSRIAAYDLGYDFTDIEIDEDYFTAQEERFARHIATPRLFTPEPFVVQAANLFDEAITL
jgi:site-specific DNA-methyltransferase (adenine-specific)